MLLSQERRVWRRKYGVEVDGRENCKRAGDGEGAK